MRFSPPRLSPLIAVLALLACTPREPPGWPEGGASVAFGPARWDRGDDYPVEIRADGRVFEGGDLLFVIDRVGRVVDADHDPVAIFFPDGRVFGTDDQPLGFVGVTNAAPPWSMQAWLALTPDGSVTRFSPEGDREALGRWKGCTPAVFRTCTLVTHLVAVRHYSPPPYTGVSVGVGVGVGF